jgi:hypothetical protein
MAAKHRQAAQAGVGVLSWVGAMTIKELPDLFFWILVILGGGLLIYAAHGYFFGRKQNDTTSLVPDLRAYNDPRFVKALNGSDRQFKISIFQ